MSPRPQIDHIRKPQILEAAAEVIAERDLPARADERWERGARVRVGWHPEHCLILR